MGGKIIGWVIKLESTVFYCSLSVGLYALIKDVYCSEEFRANQHPLES